MPWESVFKEATDSHEYWSTSLTEPAMVYLATRGAQHLGLGHQSAEGRTSGEKRDWSQSAGQSTAIKRNGLMVTDQAGREIRLAYNRGSCNGCRRIHCCEYCLGNHRGADLPCSQARRAKAKGSGKGKTRRGKDSWSSWKGDKRKGKGGGAKADKE